MLIKNVSNHQANLVPINVFKIIFIIQKKNLYRFISPLIREISFFWFFFYMINDYFSFIIRTVYHSSKQSLPDKVCLPKYALSYNCSIELQFRFFGNSFKLIMKHFMLLVGEGESWGRV